MKRLVKLFIAMIVLLFIAITLLFTLVDPNDYKAQIEAQVKQSINRDLHIKGDIGWTFYPQLGFSSGAIELDNLQGFNKAHLLKIDQASLGINILPLLKGEISLAKLTIDGLQFTLLRDKNGNSNLDNMSTEQTPADSATSAPDSNNDKSGNGFLDIGKTQLAGIDINNTVVEIEDLQAGSYQKVVINEIKLGQFALNKATEFSINTQLRLDDIEAQLQLSTQLLVNETLDNIELKQLLLNSQLSSDALPNGELQSTLKGNINYAVNSKKVSIEQLNINTSISGDNLPNKKITTQLSAQVAYLVDTQLATIKDLQLQVDALTLDGEISVQTGTLTKVRYNLIANQWDLNPYLGDATTATDDSTASEPASKEEAEPDLSFLNDLDIDGQLKIAGLLLNKVKVEAINNHLIIKQGKAQLAPLSAQLYDGLLTINASLNASNGQNRYQIASKLKDVQLLPLLKDAAEIDLISGTSNFNFNGKGQGLTTSKITQGLVGKGDFAILDGELYGININQEIRALKAKIKGQPAPTSESVKKTDFASLTGAFTISKGLINNQKLLMTSPVMRLDGTGSANIIAQSLDYKLGISPLSKTTAETDYTDLNGVTIPLIITGPFADPSFSIDTEGVLKEQLQAEVDKQKQKLKQKVQQKLQKESDKIGNKALEGVLNSLF